MNNRNRKIGCLVLLFALVLSSCSSGPATRYYTLLPDKSQPALASASEPTAKNIAHDKTISLGVGPVILPEYLDQPSVVSHTQSQRLQVAKHDAWAGSLKAMATRVLADDMSHALELDAVWGFPWDNRVRPDYQMRVVVEEFSGERGGDVVLRAKWSLLNKNGSEVYLVRSEKFIQPTVSNDVAAYVAAMNVALNQLSTAMAQGLTAYLAGNQ